MKRTDVTKESAPALALRSQPTRPSVRSLMFCDTDPTTVPCLSIHVLTFCHHLYQYHSCSINLNESYRRILADFDRSKIINFKQKIGRL